MSFWLAIAGAGLATYLVRLAPLVITLRRPAPSAVTRYLDALPIAIIAALTGPAIVLPNGALTVGPEPVGAIVALVIVRWRRNLLAGVVSGVVTVALLRFALAL